jgi:hypothetical protein
VSYVANTPIPDNLEKFELICWARAVLWRQGEYELTEAVDPLPAIAAKLGLEADRAQAVMATFFALARQ